MDALALPAIDRAMLLSSWQRRKRWEADLQAMALLKLLGEALGSKTSAGGRRGGQGRQQVDGAVLMGLAGKELQ